MNQFEERQRFTQWLVWLPVVLLMLFITWVILRELVWNQPLGDKPMDKFAVFPLVMAPLLVVVLLSILQLKTTLNETGVYYRFLPFHFKQREIRWEDIKKAYVRQYKPIQEFGGWGIRGSFRNGRAYNVSGNKGIQLELTNGKKILLGTKKEEEVELFFLHLKRRFPDKFNHEKG